MVNRNEPRYDAIVAGAGLAGLTSAVFLAQAGRRVLLIEKNPEVGGLVSSFSSDGYVFDAGARALLGVVMAMLKNLELDVEIMPSQVSLGVEDQIIVIRDQDSVGEYRDLLMRLYPESREDIDRFIQVMQKIMKLIDVIYGIDNPLFKDIEKDRTYFVKELLPWLPKFMLAMRRIEKLQEPCEDYLRGIIRDQALIDIISQHFFKGTPTFFALSYFTLYSSYVYPRGGTGQLAQAMAKKFREFGGEILTGTRISQVDPEGQYVTDEKDNRYYYDDLVWAADLTTFYEITNPGGLKPDLKLPFAKGRERIAQGKPSESVFSLYLEVDLPVTYFRNALTGHLFYTPSKKGLGDISKGEFRDLLENWDARGKAEVLDWLDRFLTYNTFEISIPAVRDPMLAPEGKTGLIVSALMEAELFEKVAASGWYEEFQRETEDGMVQVLTDSLWPELKDHVDRQFSFTPLSVEKRVGSSGGAIVGWSFEAPIPVEHKMAKINRSVHTPLPNVYQVGQWAYNPAGTPTCIITGKLAADEIVKKSR